VEEAVYLMVDRKQRKEGYRKKPGQDMTLKDTPPDTHFLQLGPTSHLSLPPDNVITF
jgi:hypothetical protein